MPESRRSRAAWIGPLLAVLAAAAVTAVIIVRTSPATPPSDSPTTSTAPEGWTLPRLNGSGVVRLADFHGHPLVLNFFASWCDPCRDELPVMVQASHQLEGRVAFAAVNSLETGDGAAMATALGASSWPLARDVDGGARSGLHDALGGTGMPITAFYDANGHLLYVAPAAMPAATLASNLHRLYGVDVTLETPQPAR